MTLQEAMERIKVYNEIYSKNLPCEMPMNKAFIMAVNALEKQIPKKPDLEGDGYDENGELIYDIGYCPNCHHEFEVYYDATKHCPECGQALDWSDIE